MLLPGFHQQIKNPTKSILSINPFRTSLIGFHIVQKNINVLYLST
jgi:hypothetical protein